MTKNESMKDDSWVFVYCVCVSKATKKEEAIYIITSAKAIFITTSTNVTLLSIYIVPPHLVVLFNTSI